MLRIPQKPPDQNQIFDNVGPDRILAALKVVRAAPPGTSYLHWDKLRHLKPPGDLSHDEWWTALKFDRHGAAKRITLRATNGQPFWYTLNDQVVEALHEIDMSGGGTISSEGPLVGKQSHERYLVTSLIEEAITSSQLEGAATTRRVANEMILSERPPRDQSEKMILNNYHTMQHIRSIKEQPLTKAVVLEIQRHVTRGTLDRREDEGRLRKPGQPITVSDDFGQVFHEPPPAEQLDERMSAMCDFANATPKKPYLHPVLRAIILHFWLAYDHPFVDGNGRTARALFYWCMLHNDFWLYEYVSISEIILQGPSKYGRAFLYTETDDNDLTYFLLYHLDVVRQAIRKLDDYVGKRKKELRFLDARLAEFPGLNARQRALLTHALRNPNHRYTIEWHQNSHGVVYQTARTDLLDLAKRGLLLQRKVGRKWTFSPIDDLDAKLDGTTPA